MAIKDTHKKPGKQQPLAAMRLPPLEPGDRLTRSEFERRYHAMPRVKKAELIVEIAASSASYDMHDKLKVYRRNGVQEYIVWQIYDKRVDWFALNEGEYIDLTPDESGVVHSRVFPGLYLAVAALLEDDLTTVLAELQKGLGAPEHAEFITRLAESHSKGSLKNKFPTLAERAPTPANQRHGSRRC